MPDVNSIPFRQADGNGHYLSKQLPNNNQDFLAILGLPVSLGNVTSVTTPSRDGQLAQYWQTGGLTIKGSTAIGIVDLVDGVVTTRLSPTGDVVGTTAIQTLSNKTLTNASIVAPSGLTKTDVGLGNVDNTADTAKPVSTAQAAALATKENLANKGVANGYAGLDATGKIPDAQLPDEVSGGVTYKGGWNALSNNPAIPLASSGNKGWYYVVTTAGTTTVDGISSWELTDWIVSNGTTWNKVDNTDAVASVAGRVGVVVLTKADVGLDQVDNTSDFTKNGAAGILVNKTISGANNTLTVRLDSADVSGNLPPSHFNSGAGASVSTFWRGDGQWSAPAGGGDVVGPGGASIDGEVALFNGSSGTVLRRGFGTGLVSVVNGVYQTPLSLTALTLPKDALAGFILSNGTDTVNDINVAVGDCRDDGNAADIRMATPLTKQLDAVWASGTVQGGRDTGAIADGTWHIYVIRNPTTLVVDVLFSLSVTAPTMPSGYTQKRRIGSIVRRTATIIQFKQIGDYFQLITPTIDINDSQTTVGQEFTLPLASIPAGLKFWTDVTAFAYNTAQLTTVAITDPDLGTAGGVANVYSPSASINGSSSFCVWTNTARSIFSRTVYAPAGITHTSVVVRGYWDRRGKDGYYG